MDKNLQTSAGSAGLTFVKPASCPLAVLIKSSVWGVTHMFCQCARHAMAIWSIDYLKEKSACRWSSFSCDTASTVCCRLTLSVAGLAQSAECIYDKHFLIPVQAGSEN